MKFAGGSFSLMPRSAVKELIKLCHRHDVLVSTGGFIEYILTQGREAVDKYIRECAELGFDTLEISTGFITVSVEDVLELVKEVKAVGLKAKPEVGIQFGAGGATAATELESEGTQDPSWAVIGAKKYLEAGAYMIMVESEGITENVKTWRTDVPARFVVNALGLDKLMFEAAEPEVFAWYIELRPRGEPVRRPQPDRPARMSAFRYLGNQEPLGPRPYVLNSAFDFSFSPAEPKEMHSVC